MKRFKEESGRHIQEFLEMGFTMIHVSSIESTIIPTKERNGMHEKKNFPKFDLHIGHHQTSFKGEILQGK